MPVSQMRVKLHGERQRADKFEQAHAAVKGELEQTAALEEDARKRLGAQYRKLAEAEAERARREDELLPLVKRLRGELAEASAGHRQEQRLRRAAEEEAGAVRAARAREKKQLDAAQGGETEASADR